MVKQISTGVEGLDTLLKGGLPQNTVIELCGTPGSGKSTLAMQFLLDGTEKGETGMYISMEQTKSELVDCFEDYEWGLRKKVEHGDIVILWPEELPRSDSISPNQLNPSKIIAEIKKYNIKRLVIDSLNVFRLFAENRGKTRTFLMELVRRLKQEKCTSLIISERKKGITHLEFEEEDYFLDGIIYLDKLKIQDVLHPTILVLKMRSVNHDTVMRPVSFTAAGLEVHSDNKVFI